jgi:translation initiation factor 1 (eIF-1/SUI1)
MAEIAERMGNLTLSAVEVYYCPVCSLPIEYCEFTADFEECKKHLIDNEPEQYALIYEGQELSQEKEPKAAKKAKKEKTKKVTITIVERTKKKRITQVRGLELFNIDLKKASKLFASKFAAAASVSKIPAGGDEILIQGECADDIFDFIAETFKIDEDLMEFGETLKKKKKEPEAIAPQFPKQ